MDSIMFWTGVVTWMLIVLAVLWLLAEVAWGFICAFSYTRWCWRLMWRKSRLKGARWRALPRDFMAHWWDFIGYRNNGSTTITEQWRGNVWRGVGDYTLNTDPVTAPKEDA